MASSRDSFRKFDATESWESYSRDLDNYFKVNGVLDDDKRLAVLLTVLSPSVYEVLRNYCHPELPRDRTYAQLSELLRIHNSDVFKKRIEFHSATQESLNDWLGRIKSLAASCDFGDQSDTVLKDKFVSGLLNWRLAFILCEKKSSATLKELVGLAEEYAPYCIETGILHLPYYVLIDIILLLTPRERLPLADSCQRLRNLIFEDPKLLRHLDFSKKAHLTTMRHIQRYFNNENACQNILSVNAENVSFMNAGDPLNNSIGKAINLVEVNIHGTKFEDISQLGSFLEPLRQLRKLSIDWPVNDGDDASHDVRILEQPFSNLTYLTYLSVRFNGTFRSFMSMIPDILPDPQKWTYFQRCIDNMDMEFYIEKDLEVCEQLLQSERLQEFLTTAPWENFRLKWALNTGALLKEVLRITHEDVPEDLSCFSTSIGGNQYLLKFEEAKMLLKDPRHQISYLHLDHDLERDPDAHLLASAYPNLTELVLQPVGQELENAPQNPYFQRRIRKLYGLPPEEGDDAPNRDSSFKMLVDNTPNLRHFTLNPHRNDSEGSVVDDLCLISGWKNLETLCIYDTLFVQDGQFLIEIGNKCQNLQKLTLDHTWGDQAASVKLSLLRMLEYCRNLRDLTIVHYNIDQADMFALLAENVELERVKVTNSHLHHSATPWISSLEKMIRQCPKLTTIDCSTVFETQDDVNKAKSAVERIKEECDRPDFQIEVNCSTTQQTSGEAAARDQAENH